MTENFIDIGIDFGAENIVVTAIGYDKLGRSDFRLLNLDSFGTIKNYIGQKKVNQEIQLGSEVKTSYVHRSEETDYSWVSGRYKGYILEGSRPDFKISPEQLLEIGLVTIIKKIEAFDFSPLLSGKLRNLCVGVPQAWDVDKKVLYRKTLEKNWTFGKVSLMPEPVAATIALYKRSVDVSGNIIMILDIGASTFDISFSEYNDSESNLTIFDLNYRSELAGHYFDLVLGSFILMSDQNKLPCLEVMDRLTRLKLRNVDDYIEYLRINQEKLSLFLSEVETIKEQNLPEIVKFNRKKVIDINLKNTFVFNKTIFQNALRFYAQKISKDILDIVQKMRNKVTSNNVLIKPLLCGGGAALFGLEKEINLMLEGKESLDIITLSESTGYKIDSTISLGLAYYAQDKSLIKKDSDFSLNIGLPTDDLEERQDFEIMKSGDSIPLFNKTITEIIGSDSDLVYQNKSNGEISFPVHKDFSDGSSIGEIIHFSMDEAVDGDLFDIVFEMDIDEVLSVNLINKTREIHKLHYATFHQEFNFTS